MGVNMIVKLQIQYSVENFLTLEVTVGFSRMFSIEILCC